VPEFRFFQLNDSLSEDVLAHLNPDIMTYVQILDQRHSPAQRPASEV